MRSHPGSGRPQTGSIPLMLGPDTAPIDRRIPILFWGVSTLLLGLAIAFFLTQGQIRVIVLLLLGVLGLLCLSPKRGVYIVLLFLPFMYFLRRQVLYFNEFSRTDPILLFPPLVTIAMFLGFIIFYAERFYRHLHDSLLMKLLLALQLIFFLQMFNPLQGNVLVGIAGALYFIIPILWVFMGLLVEERDIRRLFIIMIAIGTLTAAYGIYQHYFGLSDVEKYELEAKHFFNAFGAKARVMSTFAGIGDFSLYISTAGFLAFAHYWRTKTNPLYLVAIGTMVFALFWVAVRTSLFTLAFSIIMFLIVYARDRRVIVIRAVIAFVVIGSIYSYLYTYTPEDIWQSSGRSKDPFVVHTLSGIAHPTKETSFQVRLNNWGYIFKSAFTQYPVGRGLGSTTAAALKFAGGKGTEADSMFFELMYGSGPLASLLFVVIALIFFRDALALATRSKEPFTYRVTFGLLAAHFLGSVFGQDMRDVVNSPFAWLLIGWTVREMVNRQREPLPEPAV